MDLFAHARKDQIDRESPLAARMRPRTLDEFVGQEHVVGPGRLLRRAIQADQLSSLIFYGPPGTGKTTLAMVIANTTRSHFVTLNAVLTGVKDLRDVTSAAQEERNLYGRRTILFVDEVHRWNKAQQDALLPWVENGSVILIGATTENPYFSVNRPLLSRSRVFQLLPLAEKDLYRVAEQALHDPERGYGQLNVQVAPEALDHLVHVASGDARSLLNALELAVETTTPNAADVIVVDRTVAEESIQQRVVLYDREGDYHFDTISAFIKSLRGSDPDAALYWLAKMVYAGEDPRFIFRRMLILASEDVGLADPQALVVVQAAADTFERIGLPEGQFSLAQAALYLATAPKSNSTLGYFDALQMVRDERDDEVPNHLKDGSRDKEGFGHGQGYLYPHAFRDHWVQQQYLPTSLQGQLFYQPSDQGYEGDLKGQIDRRREEQLAAVMDESLHPTEILTFSYADKGQERWLARAVNSAAQELSAQRERIFRPLQVQRHHLILDLNASTGLLTWEALRCAPEGGVWALCRTPEAAHDLAERVQGLTELGRPSLLQGALCDLAALLAESGHDDVRFDAVVGRNAISREVDKAASISVLSNQMALGGMVSLVEAVPRHAQRLYQLVDLTAVGPVLADLLREAEERIYRDSDDPMVNWDAEDLQGAFAAGGFELVGMEVENVSAERLVTARQLERWFSVGDVERPSYADHLGRTIPPEELAQVRSLFERQLTGQTVVWRSHNLHLVARFAE